MATEYSKTDRSSDTASSDSLDIGRQALDRRKTKFVVRKIPPFVTEEDIKPHLAEFNDKYDWFFWTKQPNVLNPTRRNKINYNRFYINFKSFDDAIPFIDKFQKLTFSESEENIQAKQSMLEKYNNFNKQPQIYKLCVEFAPNQSLPKKIAKKDRRMGTIERDDEYLYFVQRLKDEKKELETLAKKAEEDSLRRNVMLVKSYSEKKQEQNASDSVETETEKRSEVAPLAQHVATKRGHNRIYKKTNRASLVRLEKQKVKRLEKIREIRKQKRIAMRAKYGKQWNASTKWIAKNDEAEYEETKDMTKDAQSYAFDKKRSRYYDKERFSRSNRREKPRRVRAPRAGGRGRNKESQRGRSSRGRGRGRGSATHDEDDSHFTGYSRRKGAQTWKAK